MSYSEYQEELKQVESDIESIKNNVTNLKNDAKQKLKNASSLEKKNLIIYNYKSQLDKLKYNKNLKQKYIDLNKRKGKLLKKLKQTRASIIPSGSRRITLNKDRNVNLNNYIDDLLNRKLKDMSENEINNVTEMVNNVMEKEIVLDIDSGEESVNPTSSLNDVLNVTLTQRDQTNIKAFYQHLIQLKDALENA